MVKIIQSDRIALYRLVNAYFSWKKISPEVCEVGVHRGVNAHNIFKILSPKKLYLFDAWDAHLTSKSYAPYRDDQSWVDSGGLVQEYYGGEISDQSVMDKNEDACRTRFKGFENVSIQKCPSEDVAKHLPSKMIDLMYVDAGHDFESAFSDMASLHQFVSLDGFLMLNDCCFSQDGVRQNFGVLEAASKFCKMFGFAPVLCTQTDFSDVVFARQGPALDRRLEHILVRSDLRYVEVPNSLFWGMRIVPGAEGANISFV